MFNRHEKGVGEKLCRRLKVPLAEELDDSIRGLMPGHFRAWGLPGDSVRKQLVERAGFGLFPFFLVKKRREVTFLLILILCEFRRSCLGIHILLFSYQGGVGMQEEGKRSWEAQEAQMTRSWTASPSEPKGWMGPQGW